jgi:hypothetical protein
MKRYLTLAVVAAAFIVGACAKESSLPNPTGEGSIRALNAIPESPEFRVLIEERLLGNATYKSVTPTSVYDDLDYTFNFEVILAGDATRTRVASQFIGVQDNTDYTMVISGALDAPDITVWEADRRDWTGSETVFEGRAAHLSTALGQVDIYIADAATPPVLGAQFATLDVGEVSLPLDFETGEYVMTITPAGDDTTILFVSDPVTISAQTQYMFTVFDADGNDLAPISVRLFSLGLGGTGALVDSRFPPQIRFIHASLNFGDADIYIEEELTTPIVTDHMFTNITPFIDVTSGTLPVTYTPPGNTGTTLIDVDESIIAGTRSDFYVLLSATDADTRIFTIADRRSISTIGRVSFMNTVGGRAAVDLYLVPSGEPVDDYAPLLPGLPRGTSPIQLPITPDSYDVYVSSVETETESSVVLAGPIPLVVDFGDVIETIIFENVDPTVVDFVVLPPP